jgi:hypothetical protein
MWFPVSFPLINRCFDIPPPDGEGPCTTYSQDESVSHEAGCGGLLFITDCVRQWFRCAILCATADFTPRFDGVPPRLKTLTEFPEKTIFTTFFSSVLTLSHSSRKSRWSRVGTSKIILDFY